MILGLGISSPELVPGKDAAKTAAFKGLKEGQHLRAKVLGMLANSKAQLLIGGQKLTAHTQIPLPPGQDILLKVTREKGHLSFKLIQPSPRQSSKEGEASLSARKTGNTASEIIITKNAATSPVFKTMKAGQVIRAKVLGMLSDSNAQLLIGGQKMIAGTSQALTAGQEIALKFIQGKDGLTFRLMPPLMQTGPGSRGIARDGVSLAKIVEEMISFEKLGRDPGPVLRHVLEGLALKSGKRDEPFLTRLLSNGGMMLEKKVASILVAGDGGKPEAAMQKLAGEDLKAALLRIISREAHADSLSGGKSSSASLARAAVSSLEHFQSLNSQPLESQRFILPFPVMADDQFNFGQLFLDTGKKESGKDRDSENRVIRLAFLLDMTSLGGLRADFSILQKSVTGRFLLQDEATCDYFKSLMPFLGQRLSSVGFQMGRVDCAVAEPRQLSPGALIEAMTAQKEVRGLDLVI